MIDPEAFAALIADWCLEVAPGQQILIETTTVAQPAATALYRAVLDREAWPLLRLAPPGLEADFYRHAREPQLDAFASVQLSEYEAADASVRIIAPAEVNAMAEVDPRLVARRMRAQEPLRAARARRRWCLTIWPTPALARHAGMQEREYGDFLRRALLLDQPDPVAAWERLRRRQARLIERLERGREIRIEAAGTDLHMDVQGRVWVNSDGRRNMPSGEVFTGPHERSASGVIRFDVPSSGPGAELAGGEVVGAELHFEDGEVVNARAEVGEDRLQAALATDAGARFVGELGIGTNTGVDRATGSTLLDEKIAGTVHLALGNSYPETGATNRSALHWDLICDLRPGGRLSLDGKVLIEDGKFLPDLDLPT